MSRFYSKSIEECGEYDVDFSTKAPVKTGDAVYQLSPATAALIYRKTNPTADTFIGSAVDTRHLHQSPHHWRSSV